MTLEAVRRLLFDCMTALPEGRINAKDGEALTRAAEEPDKGYSERALWPSHGR